MNSEMNLFLSRKVELKELLELFASFALGVLVDKTSKQTGCAGVNEVY